MEKYNNLLNFKYDGPKIIYDDYYDPKEKFSYTQWFLDRPQDPLFKEKKDNYVIIPHEDKLQFVTEALSKKNRNLLWIASDYVNIGDIYNFSNNYVNYVEHSNDFVILRRIIEIAIHVRHHYNIIPRIYDFLVYIDKSISTEESVYVYYLPVNNNKLYELNEIIDESFSVWKKEKETFLHGSYGIITRRIKQKYERTIVSDPSSLSPSLQPLPPPSPLPPLPPLSPLQFDYLSLYLD